MSVWGCVTVILCLYRCDCVASEVCVVCAWLSPVAVIVCSHHGYHWMGCVCVCGFVVMAVTVIVSLCGCVYMTVVVWRLLCVPVNGVGGIFAF